MVRGAFLSAGIDNAWCPYVEIQTLHIAWRMVFGVLYAQNFHARLRQGRPCCHL